MAGLRDASRVLLWYDPVKIIVEVRVYPGRQNPTGIPDVQMGVLTHIHCSQTDKGHPESPGAAREFPAAPATHFLS